MKGTQPSIVMFDLKVHRPEINNKGFRQKSMVDSENLPQIQSKWLSWVKKRNMQNQQITFCEIITRYTTLKSKDGDNIAIEEKQLV